MLRHSPTTELEPYGNGEAIGRGRIRGRLFGLEATAWGGLAGKLSHPSRAAKIGGHHDGSTSKSPGPEAYSPLAQLVV